MAYNYNGETYQKYEEAMQAVMEDHPACPDDDLPDFADGLIEEVSDPKKLPQTKVGYYHTHLNAFCEQLRNFTDCACDGKTADALIAASNLIDLYKFELQKVLTQP